MRWNNQASFVHDQQIIALHGNFPITDDTTLTEQQVLDRNHFEISNAKTLTLPVASENLFGREITAGAGGATATVVVGTDSDGTAGVGGAGASFDTIALTQGLETILTVRKNAAGIFSWRTPVGVSIS